MDLKHIKSFIRNGRKNRRKTKQAADRLAPLEEQIQGIMRVGEEDFKAASDLIENTDQVGWGELFRFEPVVIFILVVVLGFIAFIAWQISLTPISDK